MSTIALLVAAGLSDRMGLSLPKPYLPLGEETVLRRTIKQFLSHPGVEGVRVVIRREHHPLYRKSIEGLTLFPCVIGGDARQDSVRLGLESLLHRPPKNILVHDIARPLASHALISRVIDTLRGYKAVVPALPITDTVKHAKDNLIDRTLNRDGLCIAQTPQGYDYHTLLAAHQRFRGEAFTDDAALIEQTGEAVALVPGERDNIKITTQEDMARMQSMLSLGSETRTGIGYDVHALKPHQPETLVNRQMVKLCGIKIPFSHYLEGHSDADVGLHAIVDAILGAISQGDIGAHFPPDDRKWQGAESERFLLHAYELVKQRGGEIVHLDVTLICERPKIADYRAAMIAHIAQILKISSDRVSVKATTTEKLGFTGRAEGIAAQAVATIKLPGK